MTINGLQKELIEEIKRITTGIHLVNARGKPADLRGYQQALPFDQIMPQEADDDDPEEEEILSDELLFPYFVVKVDDVVYPEDLMENPKAKLFLLFGIYDSDPDMRGYFSMAAVVERIALRFRNDPILGAYWCEKKIQLAFQEDDTFPHFFGGIEMTWNLPLIGME